MARNYFDARDVIGAGQDAWDASQARFDRFTTNRAGQRLAAGDQAGASQTLARGGLVPQALALDRDQRSQDETAYQHGRDASQDQRQAGVDAEHSQDRQLEQAKERIEILGGLLGELDSVPEGQRLPVLQQRIQLLQHAGFPPAFLQQVQGLDEAHLTTDQLRAFGAKLSEQWQYFQQGGGIYGVNKRTQEVKTLRAADKPVILHQGDTLLGDDNRPAYTAPKTFARQPGESEGVEPNKSILRRRFRDQSVRIAGSAYVPYVPPAPPPPKKTQPRPPLSKIFGP
jgi:hypothetical protein